MFFEYVSMNGGILGQFGRSISGILVHLGQLIIPNLRDLEFVWYLLENTYTSCINRDPSRFVFSYRAPTSLYQITYCSISEIITYLWWSYQLWISWLPFGRFRLWFLDRNLRLNGLCFTPSAWYPSLVLRRLGAVARWVALGSLRVVTSDSICVVSSVFVCKPTLHNPRKWRGTWSSLGKLGKLQFESSLQVGLPVGPSA